MSEGKQDIQEALAPLMERLGKTADVAWESAARQIWLDVVETFLIAVIFAVLFLVLYRLSSHLRRRANEVREKIPSPVPLGSYFSERHSVEDLEIGMRITQVVAWLMGGLSAFLVVMGAYGAIARWLNSEWYIIDKILGAIGGS